MNTEQFDGHTPGPWDYESGEDIWAEDRLICRMSLSHSERPHYRATNADARLIAAAPNLLADNKRLQLIVHELLKDADHDTHIWFHNNGWCKDLRQPCAVCDSRSEEE